MKENCQISVDFLNKIIITVNYSLKKKFKFELILFFYLINTANDTILIGDCKINQKKTILFINKILSKLYFIKKKFSFCFVFPKSK